MSGTRKDRLQWKSKERRRTDSKDPPKVKKHRERVLNNMSARAHRGQVEGARYEPCVFVTRLEYPGDYTTTLSMFGKEAGDFSYVIKDVADCHWLLTKMKPDFDLEAEKKALQAHADRMRFAHTDCHLQLPADRTICSSAIPCKYRTWDDERQVPRCHLNRFK